MSCQKSRSRWAPLRWALVTTVAIVAEPSFAQTPTDPVAIRLKQQGDVAIESGKFEDALRSYSKALAVEPSPALHYNRGRALQALGRNAEALDEFEQFENSGSSELKAAVPDLAEMVIFVRAQISEVTVQCAVPGALLHVQGKSLSLPLSKPLRFDPATVDFEVVVTGYEPWHTRLTLSRSERRELVAQPKQQDLRGTLTVTSQALGASVSVDGKTAGTVPVEIRLDSGEHILTLSHHDYQTASSHFVLQPREHRSLTLNLEQLPHWYERWWFWTGVGAAVTTGVVVGIAMSTEKSPAKGDIPPGQITSPLILHFK